MHPLLDCASAGNSSIGIPYHFIFNSCPPSTPACSAVPTLGFMGSATAAWKFTNNRTVTISEPVRIPVRLLWKIPDVNLARSACRPRAAVLNRAGWPLLCRHQRRQNPRSWALRGWPPLLARGQLSAVGKPFFIADDFEKKYWGCIESSLGFGVCGAGKM